MTAVDCPVCGIVPLPDDDHEVDARGGFICTTSTSLAHVLNERPPAHRSIPAALAEARTIFERSTN